MSRNLTTKTKNCVECGSPFTCLMLNAKYCIECKEKIRLKKGKKEHPHKEKIKNCERCNIIFVCKSLKAKHCDSCKKIVKKENDKQRALDDADKLKLYKNDWYQQNKSRISEKNKKKTRAEPKKPKKSAEEIKKYYDNYFLNNKDSKREYDKNRRKEKSKEIKFQKQKYYLKIKDTPEFKDKKREEYLNFKNKPESEKKKAREKYNAKINKRLKSDINFKLRREMSRAIGCALKIQGSSKNNNSILDYLPYSIQELKEHLEKQFQVPGNEWMNWGNRGVYKLDKWKDDDISTWVWNIDHIIAQANFKYISMENEDFLKCWALSNLRPYSAKQNILEGSRRAWRR